MRKIRPLLFLVSFATLLVFCYISLHKKPPSLILIDVIPKKKFSDVRKISTTGTVRRGSCGLGEELYDDFCAYSPFPEDHRNYADLGSVSLCTQGTYEFLHHVTVLCQRWGGPISVAVYTPPEDFVNAQVIVNHLRQCNFCIRHWVSWSFFYRKHNSPLISPGEAFVDCTSMPHTQKRKRSNDTYPINVGRNLARNRTLTPYVFSTDIELYPSPSIPSKFERMILQSNISDEPQVWVIPVFEVGFRHLVPSSKIQLRRMYSSKKVISFHRFRCNLCHRIPNLTEWLNDETFEKSEVNESSEVMKVFTTVKRSRKNKLQEWEPFFIGTKHDPEFDPRLSWEGKQNKMQMAYEMCMKNYDFHIVSNAFLVHAPGINFFNASKEKFRAKHQYRNKKIISEIKRNLQKRYKTKDC